MDKMDITHNYSAINTQLCFMFLPSHYLLRKKTGMGEAIFALFSKAEQITLDTDETQK